MPAAPDEGGHTFIAGDPPQGVCIAFDDPSLEPDPVWTRLDDPAGYLLVTEWSIDRGRASEFDKTGTGTATVQFIDTDGTLDPTNSGSPFFGKLDPMKQAAIALRNPDTGDWHTLFRGFVSDWNYEMDITATFSRVTLELADAFDLFAALEMTPGNQGDTVPAGSEGDVYYIGETAGAKHVDARIEQALTDAGWPVELQNIFSGNVTVREVVYARGDAILTVMQDAADAEFPGVANLYVSKEGVVTFHGRFARFFPENPGYAIGSWPAGDTAAASIDADVAPISSLNFRRSKSDILNSALALWKDASDALATTLLVKDTTSIDKYGWRNVSFDSLLTYQGHDDEDETTSSDTEMTKFATYYVDNYKNPRTRVERMTFRPIHPDSFNGTAMWALLCGIEIGDLIPLTTTHPGGGGFDEDFYVEALHYNADAMTPLHPEVTLEVEVSPRSFFDSNPFGEVDEGA